MVAEIVDSGLLGEHILPTYRHARQHLVLLLAVLLLLIVADFSVKQLVPLHDSQLKPNGRFVPAGAVVHAMCIECEILRRQVRFCLLPSLFSF